MCNNIMKRNIKKIYYNPKTGFTDFRILQNRLRDTGHAIKYVNLKKWYDNQHINQIYKNLLTIKIHNHIRSYFNQLKELQADFIDFKCLSKYNHGYKYLLNIIDIFMLFSHIF